MAAIATQPYFVIRPHPRPSTSAAVSLDLRSCARPCGVFCECRLRRRSGRPDSAARCSALSIINAPDEITLRARRVTTAETAPRWSVSAAVAEHRHFGVLRSVMHSYCTIQTSWKMVAVSLTLCYRFVASVKLGLGLWLWLTLFSLLGCVV